jgi:hypothetical protein
MHVKYDGIISKARVIKDRAHTIKNVFVSKRNTNDMGVENEGKPLVMEPYQYRQYQ